MSDAPVALRHDGIVEVPGWFGPAERPLFGWFVQPQDGAVRGAVILCQPLGEEANMAYRTFRRLSQRLAAAGYLAVRLDYDGTGDSAGAFEDPGRVDAWLGSIAAAVREVRGLGVDRVSVIGMRVGATLAWAAAARGGLDLDALVLWDPCPSGRTFLREMQLLHEPWLEGRTRAPEGWAETPSYRFAPDTVAGLRALKINPATPAADLARHTVVMHRDDRTPPAALRRALPADAVEWLPAVAQAALMDVATLAVAVPMVDLVEVVAAVVRATPDGADVWQAAPTPRPRAQWHDGRAEVDEEAVFLGPERDLFAVRTQGAAPDPALPVLLFPSVSSERHLGEGALNVRLARRAAADGYVAVRFDNSGIGDSATRRGHVDDTVYDEVWIDDIARVAAEVDAGAGVIGVGLCSAGSVAFEGAIRGALAGVIGINVGLSIPADAVLDARWLSYVRHPRWVTRISRRHRRLAQRLWGAAATVRPQAAPLWNARVAVAGGADVTLLMGDDDLSEIAQNRLWSATWGRRLRRSGRFRVVPLADADHSLRVSSGQDAALTAIFADLRRRREQAVRTV